MTVERPGGRTRGWLRRVGPARAGDRLPKLPMERLGKQGRRDVVILADPAHPDALRRWLHEFATDRVSVVSVDASCDVGTLTTRVARLNGQDVIVTVLGAGALVSIGNQGDLLAALLLHLRAGGAYVVDKNVDHLRRTPGHLDEILAAAEDRAEGRALSRDERAVVAYIRNVWNTEEVVVVTKRGRHALKLREDQITDLLPVREPAIAVSVLEVRPSGRLDLGMDDRSYGPSRADPWPTHLAYPEMTLRHYEGPVISVGGMRLRAGMSILPESFRWPHAKNLLNPRYDSVTAQFARPDRREPARELAGDHYFADSLFSGHFGHLTTEVLSRLWGWDRARREIPGLKIFFHTNPARGKDGSLERRLFTAFGVPESRLVSSDRPVLLRSVVGASPMWHNKQPFYAHPDIKETWSRLTSGLLAGSEPAPHERIFVSRGPSLRNRRGCRNQQDVERFFSGRGFHVCYPEELPLSEQARLFAGARVVAGFGGSAMFNLMHCRALEAAVVISHHAYVARNEHLFTSLLGGQLHYFWQPSDIEPPEVGRTKASDNSSFAFDFAAYGGDLARLLAEL